MQVDSSLTVKSIADRWLRLLLGAGRTALAALFLISLSIAPASADENQCSLRTESMGFGTYLAGQTNALDGAIVITLTCDGNGGSFDLRINAGQFGTTNSRAMGSSADRLRYDLYSDSQRTAKVRNSLDVPRKGKRRDVTVYGRVPANQDVRPGSYTDTVTVTVLP